MLKILLKKQLMEVFRTYFYDAKRNKARSKAGVVGWILFFIIIMVGVLGGAFTALSLLLAPAMVKADMGWLYFTFFSLLAIVLGAFGSVFNTFSGLYLAKDNDLLLSSPVPIRDIIASRLLNVYLMGLMYSAVVEIPSVIVYLIRGTCSVRTVLGGLWLIVLISLIVLDLSCLLGWCVAKLSVKLKNKSFLTVIIAIAGIGLYYFFYFRASAMIRDLIMNVVLYGQKVKTYAYGLYLFGSVGEGKTDAVLICTAVVLLLVALTWKLLSKTFLSIATAQTVVARKKAGARVFTQKGVFATVFAKEMERFTSSANYMLNCGIGSLFLLGAVGAILIKGRMAFGILAEVFGERAGSPIILLVAALIMIDSMNDSAAPSVSLEGKNIWILQTLPVETFTVLKAKMAVQIALSGILMLLCDLAVSVVLGIRPLDALLITAVTLTAVVLSAEVNLFLGLKLPNLAWTSEIAPIKQNLGVFFAALSGWIYAAVFAALYLWQGYRIGLTVYLALFLLLNLILIPVLLNWHKTKGCRIFTDL